MSEPRVRRCLVALAAGLVLALAALPGTAAQPPDLPTRAAQLAHSKTAQVLYSPLERTAIEGVSLVRHVYSPAEYVLLGAPALALSLAGGGPLGLAKKLAFDTVVELIRESLEHPEQASRKIARSTYDLGLAAYRANYQLYGKVKKGEPFTAQEARAFLMNWHLQDYMGAAKQLYNATSTYEGKDILRQPDKVLLQQLGATAIAQARETFGPLAAVEISALLKAAKLEFTVFEAVVRASLGLGAYPPYQAFLEDIRPINEALRRDVGSGASGPEEHLAKVIVGQDGAEMVLVPAGEFWTGCNECEAGVHMMPRRKVYLDAYYIDRFEVTNSAYRKFVDETDVILPLSFMQKGFNGSLHPLMGVRWYEAAAYCSWAGKRLPTEAEWEKAARGTDGREFPWGNQWDGTRLRQSISGAIVFEPVGSYPTGSSPYGVYDMLGGVSEWVADWYSKDQQEGTLLRNPQGPQKGREKVVRGTNWMESGMPIPLTKRNYEKPEDSDLTVGFRCAKGISSDNVKTIKVDPRFTMARIRQDFERFKAAESLSLHWQLTEGPGIVVTYYRGSGRYGTMLVDPDVVISVDQISELITLIPKRHENDEYERLKVRLDARGAAALRRATERSNLGRSLIWVHSYQIAGKVAREAISGSGFNVRGEIEGPVITIPRVW